MPDISASSQKLIPQPIWTFVLVFTVLSLVAVNWMMQDVHPEKILVDVKALTQIPGLESKWLYAGLLIFTASFPLIFGFLPQLKFYNVLPQALLASLPVTLFFIMWDAYFTQQGVWDFSSRYTTGLRLLWIPWEEWMFFIIIPMACTFIYWSLNYAIKDEPFARLEKQMTYILAGLLAFIGIWKWDHMYTATTALLTSAFLLYHVRTISGRYRGRFYLTYLVSCIPFLIVNGILTGGFTQSPVVMYNPEEYFGIRVGTIPVDDFMYSLLMLFGNITLFEYLLQKKEKAKQGV